MRSGQANYPIATLRLVPEYSAHTRRPDIGVMTALTDDDDNYQESICKFRQ